ncbi:Putative acyl-CoA carboxylase alpha subunit AccA [Mycobacteroides abscessus]|nr:Putative acyl-CoA carboxylase alpha subunit AccA [Mycobacteroides abscessus]
MTLQSVLIANRGEIAVRIASTLRAMGIRSIAVYTDGDTDHLGSCDTAVRLGADSSGYLDIDAIISAAKQTGAQAIHPGYGFVSENADFVRACQTAGIVFVGPPAEAMDAMGDKIRAKDTVAAAGEPVVPGSVGALSDAELVFTAEKIGAPLIIKPSAGGGGKGMRVVHDLGGISDALVASRREAAALFGDDTLLVERYLARPRHIEVQVFGDTHGNMVHLGERECSLQRRHQKVIEEAPSAVLTPQLRAAMGQTACQIARSVGYFGAGTVEFILDSDAPESYYFMEMNTRLQVEHPVTEMVTGIDLVQWQILVAAGERLPLSQEQIVLSGHAVEARVYAEDPAREFLPTGGTVALARFSGTARTDTALATGSVVGTRFDPMLAKVIVHAADRDTALAEVDRALAETRILGVGTNIDFLRALVTNPVVMSGDIDTALLDKIAAEYPPPPHPRGCGWRRPPCWTVNPAPAPSGTESLDGVSVPMHHVHIGYVSAIRPNWCGCGATRSPRSASARGTGRQAECTVRQRKSASSSRASYTEPTRSDQTLRHGSRPGTAPGTPTSRPSPACDTSTVTTRTEKSVAPCPGLCVWFR